LGNLEAQVADGYMILETLGEVGEGVDWGNGVGG
jgi:hypothetical protein